MKSFTTCALIATAGLLAASTANAAMVTVADYDFEDNANPAGFADFGAPTYAGGQLVLNGSSGINGASAFAPLAGVDNFAIEAIVTADSFDAFDFVLSNSVGGTNVGYAILAQAGGWQGLRMGVGFTGSTPNAVGATVALAIVRDAGVMTLYVDGVANATTQGSTSPDPTEFSIGYNPADGAGSGFNGSIDQVRLSTFAAGGFETTDLLQVPEPGSLALLGLGGLMIARRRRG